MERQITGEIIAQFAEHLEQLEKSPATVEKYTHDISRLMDWINGETLTSERMREWKEFLLTEGLSPKTVNTKICAFNKFATFMGWNDLRLKSLRVQRTMFRSKEKELTRSEYEKLIKGAAESLGKQSALIIETIGATGMRVSEVKYLTLESVKCGRVEISLKGKIRTIILPNKLQRKLAKFADERGIKAGVIFMTRNGNPVGRKQIWAQMKAAALKAGIQLGKVYPHNLRHLFARVYYKATRNLAELASLLGHSSMETTRIYLLTTEESHQRMLNCMHLVC